LTKEKTFVIPEVDRCACALIKSVLAINGTVRAQFIWEPTFRIWWRLVKNWQRWRLSNALTLMWSKRTRTRTHTHRCYARTDMNWLWLHSLSNTMYIDWTDNNMFFYIFLIFQNTAVALPMWTINVLLTAFI